MMIATFYVGGSAPMEGGKYLANGQVYDNKEFFAAHRTLPFGTLLHAVLSGATKDSLKNMHEFKYD